MRRMNEISGERHGDVPRVVSARHFHHVGLLVHKDNRYSSGVRWLMIAR
jgi:hypothetical protein